MPNQPMAANATSIYRMDTAAGTGDYICVHFSQVSFQMQQLLDQSLSSDSWSPLKIKFNWDASYWTKQLSSFGKEL